MAVEIETVLVPVDETAKAARAVEYGLTVADRYDAEVHVLHVIDDELRRAVQSDPAAAAEVAADHQAFLDGATANVETDGDIYVSASVAVGFSKSQLRTHPVSVVLETAANVGADFIVVPRESLRDDPTAMLGKVAQYVLSYASQPVLSV